MASINLNKWCLFWALNPKSMRLYVPKTYTVRTSFVPCCTQLSRDSKKIYRLSWVLYMRSKIFIRPWLSRWFKLRWVKMMIRKSKKKVIKRILMMSMSSLIPYISRSSKTIETQVSTERKSQARTEIKRFILKTKQMRSQLRIKM